MRTEAAHRHRPNLSRTPPPSAGAAPRNIDDDTVDRLVTHRAVTPARPLDDLIHGPAPAADSEIAAAAGDAAPSELPGAAAQAHELMELVRRLRYRPGLYRFGDCALEYLSIRPGAGQQALGSMLDPLEGWPELLDTLHCHLRHNGYRRATARALRGGRGASARRDGTGE